MRRAVVSVALVTASLAGVAAVGRAPAAGAAPGPAPSWRKVTPASSPTAHTTASMAYDTATDQLILFGGDAPSGFSSTTWVWTGSTWAKLNPTNRPAPRGGAAMAYDPATGRLILFGGFRYYGTSSYYATTWAWNGSTWTQLGPTTEPTVRGGGSMVYDPATGRLILFGGYDEGLATTEGYIATTWAWNGSTWTQLHPATHPLARTGAALAYDATTSQLILFGGYDYHTSLTATYFATTWVWTGTDWTELNPSAHPTGRAGASMVYDPQSSQLVLFGGYHKGGYNRFYGYLSTTWVWNGTTWAEVAEATYPRKRSGAPMAYDPSHGDAVLFGGTGPTTAKPCTTGFCSLTYSTTWELAPAPTVAITPSPLTLIYGQETGPSFTVAVVGSAAFGYPEGTVAIETGTTAVPVSCTASGTHATTAVTTFTCRLTSPTELQGGAHPTVTAAFTPGTPSSSKTGYSYGSASSPPATFNVQKVLATTTVVIASSPTTLVYGTETGPSFTVTATGQAGHGVPEGGITLATASTPVQVTCTAAPYVPTTHATTFFCRLVSPTELQAGVHPALAATFAPGTPSSSSPDYLYEGATSPTASFVVGREATTSTVATAPNPLRVTYHTEKRPTFTVTVTGQPGHGYPEGTVALETGTTTEPVSCVESTTHATTDTTVFTCHLTSGTELHGGSHTTVSATFAPGTPSSSAPDYSYVSRTSPDVTVHVAVPSLATATRIAGPTADATAAAELAHQFPAAAGTCPVAASVVLVRDDSFSDALASQYLAGFLGTGTLLTPTSQLSSVTEAAIRDEGIAHVYIVGGSLAVSTTVARTVESLPAYRCGGTTPRGTTVQVTRIAGRTAYATAQVVAAFVGLGFVGRVDVADAYPGMNPAGGAGAFNATAGTGSASAAAGTLRTAIVATGASFQDAESASVISYAEHFPILLTGPASLAPQAAATIRALAITQVVVMGGPLAVSDVVVAQLEALGVSVLRVAGADYTGTALEAADFEMSIAGLNWAPEPGLVVARGNGYTDGLAGALVAAGEGPAAGRGPEPLVLTETPTSVGPYLGGLLADAGTGGIEANGRPVTSLTILGGDLAITTAAVRTMLSDLRRR